MRIFLRLVGKLIHITLPLLSRVFVQKGVVYMFHSIGDGRDEFNLPVDAFDSLLQKMSQLKIVVSLSDWEKKDRFICLTFDDVPESFYHNAFPLLKKYQMPFTIFVSSSLLDADGYITRDMLIEMSECEYCLVASHGRSHSFFVNFSEEEALSDLYESKRMLEELIGRTVELYAFPYGSIYACGLKQKKLVDKVYKYGFGTIAMPITHPLLLPSYYLPRINVDENSVKVIEKTLFAYSKE